LDNKEKRDVLQGTLDLLILRTLALRPMHGYGIAQRIEQITGGVFKVTPGSLFPALHKMEEIGWIEGSWGTSENNRRAKYYEVTKAGWKQLELEKKDWNAIAIAVSKVLEST
jgi:PadR family transcriptional regulator PadR